MELDRNIRWPGGPDRGQTVGPPRRRALRHDRDKVVPISIDEATTFIRDAGPDESPDKFVWIDILRPSEADGQLLREVLGFHPLAVHGSIHGRHNPKLERHPDHYFLVLYAGRVNAERNRPAFCELDCFIGTRFLVTVRRESIREVRELAARWRTSPQYYPSVGHLAHGIADTIVDSYFPMIDHFSARVAAVEVEVYERPSDAMQDIMSLRREMLRFRAVVAPARDVLASFLRRDLPLLNPDLMLYFQDVRDHAVHVTEEIDMLRDMLSAAVDAQFTVTSNQLNKTVRMMTAWSIILMTMALVTGIYGMNFINMPEIEWHHGYKLALGAMLAIGLLLLTYFRRRKWL